MKADPSGPIATHQGGLLGDYTKVTPPYYTVSSYCTLHSVHCPDKTQSSPAFALQAEDVNGHTAYRGPMDTSLFFRFPKTAWICMPSFSMGIFTVATTNILHCCFESKYCPRWKEWFCRKAGHGPDGWMVGPEVEHTSFMITTRNKVGQPFLGIFIVYLSNPEVIGGFNLQSRCLDLCPNIMKY